MHIFLYDKTFDGLLCAIFDAYTRKDFPDALLGVDAILPLTATTTHTVVTSPDNAARVFTSLQRKLSQEGRTDLMHVWLSEESGSDFLLFRYIRKVFDSPRLIEKNFADPDALAVSQLAKKVGCETHKLAGFVRFQLTVENIYFAAVAPKYNTLPLLLDHFADRFADQDWIIYDTVRHYGVFFDQGAFRDVSLDETHIRNGSLTQSALADGEALFRQLWKGYFKATAIRERANPALQARCMPRRYWKHLTEKQ